MTIPTEPIGSIPRPRRLIEAVVPAGEQEWPRVLDVVRRYVKPDQRVFVDVVSPIDPRVDTSEEVIGRVLEAAAYNPPGQLGTCDDCGSSPFRDATTNRDTAFAKVRARVRATALAAELIGGK